MNPRMEKKVMQGLGHGRVDRERRRRGSAGPSAPLPLSAPQSVTTSPQTPPYKPGGSASTVRERPGPGTPRLAHHARSRSPRGPEGSAGRLEAAQRLHQRPSSRPSSRRGPGPREAWPRARPGLPGRAPSAPAAVAARNAAAPHSPRSPVPRTPAHLGSHTWRWRPAGGGEGIARGLRLGAWAQGPRGWGSAGRAGRTRTRGAGG